MKEKTLQERIQEEKVFRKVIGEAGSESDQGPQK